MPEISPTHTPISDAELDEMEFRDKAGIEIDPLPLIAEVRSLRDELRKTPSAEKLKKWVEWVNGPMILQQVRAGKKAPDPEADIVEVQKWLTEIIGGAHQKALPEVSKPRLP